MTYDRYYNLISKVARVKDFFKRHILLFVALVCIVAALITAFIYSFGSFTEEVTCTNIVYGDQISFNAKAFLSNVSFEFSKKGSETWSADIPFLPGEYTVRASTDNVIAGVRTSEADFTISAKDVVITANSTEVFYGSPEYSFSSDGLVYADKITEVTYIADKKPTDEGSVSINSFKIVSESGADVSSAYKVTLNSGDLKVKKRPISFAVRSVKKEYDATPIVPEAWYISSGTLAEGDTAEVEFFGTQTEIGVSNSEITSYRVLNSNGEDVTYCYDVSMSVGKVEVTKISIVISTGSLEGEYDGTEKPCNTFDITSDKFFGDDYLVEDTVKFRDAPIFAGTYQNNLVSVENIIIRSKETGEDVTHRYAITVSPGSIKINRRKITLKTPDIVVQYSGNNVSDRGKPEIISGSLALSDKIQSVSYKGSIINVGKIDNAIERVVIYNDILGTDVTSSYSISYDTGTVEVIKRKITVKSPDISKVYDGKPLIPEGKLVFLEGHLAEGDKISCKYFNTITDAGKIANDFQISLDTENALVANVDRNYDITVKTGTLEVFPRPVILKSPVSVFKYDGEIHFTSDNLYIYDGSLAYGHKTVVLTRSSITEVGAVENVFVADIRNQNDVSVAGNYSIEYMYGHLVVLPQGASGLGNTEIFGEPDPDYDFIPPQITIPHDPPPNSDNDDDDDVSYIPPTPPDNIPGSSVGNQNPELPPDLQYPSRGEDDNKGEGGNSGGEEDDDPVLFEVFTDKRQTIFLRGTSYGNYNGKSWEEGIPYTSNYISKNPLLYASDRLKAIPGFNANVYELKVRGTNDFYSTYFSTSFPTRMLSDVANKAESKEYSVFFYDFEDTRKLIFDSSPISNKEIDEYTKWVYANYLAIDPALKEQLIAIAAENGVYETSPTLISDVVYYLKKTAKYNLNYAEYPTDQDTIIYFLTTAKEGICIHYAGAAALLYRSYGIPARVAVGYKCKTKAGEWTQIKSPAHAWVEIYVDGAWYPIEATPSGSGSNLFDFLEDPLFEKQNAFPEFRPEIKIEFPNIHKYYDGKALTAPAVKVTGDKLKPGHKLIARSGASITYVGTVEVACDELAIVDEKGNDVMNEYCVRIVNGSLTVKPISPEPVQKLIYMNTGDRIRPSERILFDLYSGEEKKVSTVPYFMLSSITFEGKGAKVNTLSTPDYDPLNREYELIGTGDAYILFVFDNIDVNGDGVFEYVGSTQRVAVDVSHFSNIKFRHITSEKAIANGSIDLSKRFVYTEYVSTDGRSYSYLALSTVSASKLFDGAPLLANGVEILSGTLLEGHSIHVKCEGNLIYTGRANNKCREIRIVDANGDDVTYMYAIDVFDGILDIYPSSVLPKSFEIAMDKDDIYDLNSVEWISLIKKYPLTATVTEGGKSTIVENNMLIGIKQGTSVVQVTFAAVDLNFDGIFEYDNVTYMFNVDISDPDVYENMFVVIIVAIVLLSAIVSTVIVLILNIRRKKLGIPSAQEEAEVAFDENEADQSEDLYDATK